MTAVSDSTDIRTLLSEAIQQVRSDEWELRFPKDRIILAISGVPGSGKSTLAERLSAEINDLLGRESAIYIPMDGFHLSESVLKRYNLKDVKGAVQTFDSAGWLNLMERIDKDSKDTVFAPSYSHQLHEPVANSIAIESKHRVVVVEGNYLGLYTTSPVLAQEEPSFKNWMDAQRLYKRLWHLKADAVDVRERLIERKTTSGWGTSEASRWYGGVDQANILFIQGFQSPISVHINPVNFDKELFRWPL